MRQKQNVPKQDDCAVVQSISIATPCHVDWESMSGDERKRFCGQCKLNVYNVSTMSTREAADFIRQSEGRACVSLYRRADGTIITDNCPVAMRKLRDRAMAKSAAVAALLTLLGVAGVSQAHGQNLGAIAPGNFCERPASFVLTPWLVRKYRIVSWPGRFVHAKKGSSTHNWLVASSCLDLSRFYRWYYDRFQLLKPATQLMQEQLLAMKLNQTSEVSQ